jgi:hypothetical protein
MNALASTTARAAAGGDANERSGPGGGRPAPKSRPWLRDAALVLLLAALVVLAWQIRALGGVPTHGPLVYWLGVAGASMMALLFLYPLRKYAGFMRRTGKVKAWFWFHLVMGVAGPWLIVVHSGLRAGSLNAAVALYSMAMVVGSGLVGRFLYVRLNSRLEDAEARLDAVRHRAGFAGDAPGTLSGPSALHYAPAVERRLMAFEARELAGPGGRWRAVRQVVWLPLQRHLALRLSLHQLHAALAACAAAGRWSADERARRTRRATRLVDDYLDAVMRVARQRAIAQVFALWHIAHLPFIYLLVISTVVHVIAVHAY